MGRISEQVIEQIRSAADIVEIVSNYVELKKRGRNFFGLCPFHGEKTPSFSVNHERQIYKCFGCGVGGGVINFIMEIEGLDFINAIKNLANQYSIDIEIEEGNAQSKDLISQLYDVHLTTANIFLKNLVTEEGSKILNHLENRGLSREIIKKFKLGYSLSKKDSLLSSFRSNKVNSEVLKKSGLFIDTQRGYIDRFSGRIMFSIYNTSGNIIAFAGRIFQMENSAKYINSPETSIYRKSKILYGIHETKHFIRERKSAIIVEGYMDFLQLYQANIKNIVAVSGTAFTPDHALQLKRFCKTIYLAYDGDSAGKTAAIKAGYVLLRAGLSAFIVNVPEGIDPDDWVKKDGPTLFLDAVKNSSKLLSFHFNNYAEDLQSTSGKTSFVNDVLVELSLITDPIVRELYCKELSEIIGISHESIFQSINKIIEKQKRSKSFKIQNTSSIKTETTSIQLLEYDLIRLCFCNDKDIRKYLFDNIKVEWLKTQFSSLIYEKIYIHLSTEAPPAVDLIMSELKEQKFRDELAMLVFDLDKINPSMRSARECVMRLKKLEFDNQIQLLRLELKEAESTGIDPLVILKKIENLQNNKKNISFNSDVDK